LERKIDKCEIVPNTEITASFFPERSYLLRVTGSGFLRNQIRLMMGSLVMLGNGEKTLEDFKASLDPEVNDPATFIAPGSGLMLNKVDFE
jgi:tRNA pseudouridine38-40 synthase